MKIWTYCNLIRFKYKYDAN